MQKRTAEMTFRVKQVKVGVTVGHFAKVRMVPSLVKLGSENGGQIWTDP